MKHGPKSPKIALIFNPYAGKKKNFLSLARGKLTALEDIKDLLKQYQISAEYWPTKYPGHATVLAKVAAQKKYNLVISAGGDGTVGETANGLIHSSTTLAI